MTKLICLSFHGSSFCCHRVVIELETHTSSFWLCHTTLQPWFLFWVAESAQGWLVMSGISTLDGSKLGRLALGLWVSKSGGKGVEELLVKTHRSRVSPHTVFSKPSFEKARIRVGKQGEESSRVGSRGQPKGKRCSPSEVTDRQGCLLLYSPWSRGCLQLHGLCLL